MKLSVFIILSLGVALQSGPAFSQTASPPAKSAPADRASAYYNFAMGHLYAELAGAYGNRGDYFNKAIEFYKQAMKADPSATFLVEEITDLYIQAGRTRDAVIEAEELLKQNPDNIEARRTLGRIYTRLIGDTQQNRINEEMLRKSIEQFEKITDKDPKDLESWLMLGRLYRAAHKSPEAEKAYRKAIELDANNEEALTGLALVYSDIGDTKNAIEVLRVVTARNPSLSTLSALAGSYEQMRDYANAAEALKKALEVSPDNARIKRALAQDLLYADKYDEALQLYNEIAAADPKDAQAQLRISEVYRQKRDFEKARQALAKAKELDPNSLETRFVEVNLFEAEGKTDEAIATLKGILDETAKKGYSESEKNNRVMLLERLGFLYRGAGQYQKAIEAFREIAGIDSEAAPRVAVQVVQTYRDAKDFARAQEEAQKAKNQFPKDRNVIAMHASLMADLGKTDQAIAEMRQLLNAGKDRETYIAMAQIYEKGKRYAEMGQALDEAEKLSESKQDQATVHFMRGAMYEKMKKYDAAEAEFHKVLEAEPDSAGALNYLGYMLADRDVRLEEAHQLIRKAVEIEPHNGAFLDSLGWVLFRMNKLEEAEAYLRRAVERVGNDPTVHDHLGDVYLKEGKLKDAIAQWQRSLEEWRTSPQSELDPNEVVKVTKKLESAKVRLAKETSQR